MAATNPILFDFLPEGFVSLLDHSADTLPRDFEIIAQVSYKLDRPAAPKRIEFTTSRGNDVFLRGTTSLQIALYSEDSFTTVNPESGQRAEWVRVQTHRYFLTFAASSGTPEHGGPAFATFTTLDGGQPKVEALGIQITKDAQGKPLPLFGPIPEEVYNRITEESEEDRKKDNKDHTVTMRLELSASEFERTHKVFEVWDKYVKTNSLPNRDPYTNGIEFFRKLIDPINKCGEKLRLEKAEGLPTKDNIRHQPIDFIRMMRGKNQDLHVKASFYPWGWRPMLQ